MNLEENRIYRPSIQEKREMEQIIQKFLTSSAMAEGKPPIMEIDIPRSKERIDWVPFNDIEYLAQNGDRYSTNYDWGEPRYRGNVTPSGVTTTAYLIQKATEEVGLVWAYTILNHLESIKGKGCYNLYYIEMRDILHRMWANRFNSGFNGNTKYYIPIEMQGTGELEAFRHVVGERNRFDINILFSVILVIKQRLVTETVIVKNADHRMY